MYFDFEDRYDEYQPVGGGLRRWDGVALSMLVHAAIIVIGLLIPTIDLFGRAQKLAELQQQIEEQKRRERPEFVFVQPRVDMKALRAPDRAEMSDIDRKSSAPERSPNPSNPLPSARGNSSERVEASPELRARGQGPNPEPSPEPPAEAVERPIEPLRDQREARLSLPQQQPVKPSGGSLGEALKNLQKYVDQESFNNQPGNVQDLGPLQFDTKGVEFGPWIRRFVSQVRRNWFVPYAAMTMRGHVVLTFFVHRNGALTDVTVVQPSAIESFNTAAVNALRASNPTEPLPREYPDDKAFFTVTFYYNESPGR